ncbi:MAG: lysophospholipid acyltransferase family protein [Spirochaetaceae bacterium]
MKTYFPGDSYQTPPDVPKPVLRVLSGAWRWFFYLQYFVEGVRTSMAARFGTYTDEDWAESSYNVMRIIERNGGRFDITGFQHVRENAGEGPFVFVSNHMSTLETQVYPVLIVPFMPVTFVVKAELMKHPFLGPVLETRDPIPVSRKNPRDDLKVVLEEGPKRLRRGMSLIIFPQATRTPRFRRASFNSLGTKLAASVGVKAVPMAIKSDFWGERGLIRGFGPIRPECTIHVEFGEPVEVSGRGRHAHEYIVDFIETRLRAWGADVGATPPAPR